jgi:hypothetical protein
LRRHPWLRQTEPGEQLAAAHAEQIGNGAGLAMRADIGREVLAGEDGAGGDEVGKCALEDDPAAVVATRRASAADSSGGRTTARRMPRP